MWTTDDLVAAVKRKAQSPSGGFQLTDAQILDIAFEATTKIFVPAIRSVREDFFTTYETITLVDGVASYRLPKRASSTTIKQVIFVQTGEPGRAWVVPRVSVSEGYTGIGVSSATPAAYVIEGAQIRFLGAPNNVGQYVARVYYQRRPSRYVPVSSSSRVTVISSTTSFELDPNATWLDGPVDVMSPEPEADLIVQSEPVLYGVPTMTFTGGATTAQMSVGDYVAKADTTPIVLLPDAFNHLLVDATTAECLRSIGDYDSAASIMADMNAALPGVVASIAMRAESQPLPIRNRSAGLYQRGYRYGGWWQA